MRCEENAKPGLEHVKMVSNGILEAKTLATEIKRAFSGDMTVRFPWVLLALQDDKTPPMQGHSHGLGFRV